MGPRDQRTATAQFTLAGLRDPRPPILRPTCDQESSPQVMSLTPGDKSIWGPQMGPQMAAMVSSVAGDGARARSASVVNVSGEGFSLSYPATNPKGNYLEAAASILVPLPFSSGEYLPKYYNKGGGEVFRVMFLIKNK